MKLYQKFFETNMINDKDKIKTKMNVAAGIIIKKGENDENLVLLIRRSPSDFFPLMYENPRGKCDEGPNESIKHCLIREVKEETGLDVIPLAFIDKFSYLADNGTRESIQYNFLCKMVNEKQKVKLSNEHDDFIWISTVGQVELYVMPEIKKTISKVLNIDTQIINYPENELSDNNIKEYLERIQK